MTAEAATRVARLRHGIGASRAADSVLAGRQAAQAAVSALDDEPVALVLVYASIRYDLPALVAGVRSITGEAPLAGASSSGQFHNGQAIPPGQGVTVLAATAGPYRFGVGTASGVRTDPAGAGRALARSARAAAGATSGGHAALLLLSDGLIGPHQELLSGAHRVAGAAVPVVGGAASDDGRLTEAFVFSGDRVLSDAAVGIWITAPWPLTVVSAHGWRPAGLPRLVTKVAGTVVHEIAGRPAAETFRDCSHDHHASPLNCVACQCPCCGRAEPGGQPADDVPPSQQGYHATHALGVIQPDGSLLIRGTYTDDLDQLRTFGPLPLYSAVQVVSAAPDDLLTVADTIVPRAVGERLAGERSARLVLLFSCAARWNLLGARGPEEAARIQAAAGEVDTFGFYTYGEFARTTSVCGYHNATLTAIAL